MKIFCFISIILFFCGFINLTNAQLDAFSLLQNQNYAPKPTITPDLVKYFELDGHARELVDMLTGPRPGGFFPEKTYEVANKPSNNLIPPSSVPDNIDPVERAVEKFLAEPSNIKAKEDFQFPPGFNQGFSLSNGDKALTSFQETNKPAVCFINYLKNLFYILNNFNFRQQILKKKLKKIQTNENLLLVEYHQYFQKFLNIHFLLMMKN